MNYETKCITDISEVPDGFVPLSDFNSRSRDHKRLSDAHKQGLIRAVKLVRTVKDFHNGRVWVEERGAREFLSCDSRVTNTAAVADSTNLIAAINARLSRIESLLERIASASEAIATEPVGSWRDANGDTL